MKPGIPHVWVVAEVGNVWGVSDACGPSYTCLANSNRAHNFIGIFTHNQTKSAKMGNKAYLQYFLPSDANQNQFKTSL